MAQQADEFQQAKTVKDPSVSPNDAHQKLEDGSRYRSLFLNSPEAMLIADAEGNIREANRMAAHLLGFTDPVEMEGVNIRAFYVDPQIAHNVFETLRRDGFIQDGFARLKKLKGSDDIIDISGSVTLLRDEQDEPILIEAIFTDITERRRAEAKAREQQNALARLATSITFQQENLERSLQEIVKTSAEVLEISRVGIWIYDSERSKISCLQLYNQESGAFSSGMEILGDDFPKYFKALEEDRTIVAHNVFEDERTVELVASYLRPLNISSMLDSPIRLGGQAKGVVCHEHVGPPREWTADDERFAASIGDIVSTTLAAAQQKQHILELQILNQLISLGNQKISLKKLFAESLNTLLQWSDLDRGGIYILNETTQLIELQYGRNIHPVLQESAQKFDPKNSLLTPVFAKGKFFILSLSSNKQIDPAILASGIKSIIAQPIMWEGEVIGCLVASSSRRSTYTEAEKQFLEAFGQQLGTIVARIQAEEKIQIYTTELERSNRELQRFVSISAHDLQEPLRKIQVFSNKLLTKSNLTEEEKKEDYLKRIDHAARKMQSFLEDYHIFTQVNVDIGPYEKSDLSEVVDLVIHHLQPKMQAVEAKIIVEKLPSIDADAHQMQILFQNLIENGLKFRKKDAQCEIRIWSESATGDKYCRIIVADNGIGFDEKYSERIFSVFKRLHSQSAYQGTGIGLAICRKIVERHHGNITARSIPNEGAKFIITLPISQSRFLLNSNTQ